MAVRLGDVARHAGVSLATASRVLNGSSRTVSDVLADRVRASAEALGYLPNAPAQALARASTATVGVLLHDIADPYFGAVARGASDAAAAAGLLSLIVSTDGDPEVELRSIRMLHAQRVRAIVLAGSGYADPDQAARMDTALAAFRASGGAVVAITDHGPAYDTVFPANREGAAELARALVALGHRAFAVISGPEHLLVPHERLSGVRQALRRAGVELPDEAVVHTEFSREGGRMATVKLLDHLTGARRPTAVIALSDVCAVGVLAELRERGIEVPEQMSVAGFDDIPLAGDLAPPLTTVRVPLESMGAEAVRRALGQGPGRKGDGAAGGHDSLPTEVVLRGSTAGPWRP